MTTSYELRREEIEAYFDRTAADAWAKLTSDAPVGKIRATVRAGRDQMRETLLSFLPADLRGQRVLDAGCGTGALAMAAAARGASVVAIDLSPTLIQLAQERYPSHVADGTIEFKVHDMVGGDLGRFDWVVAMDSLIHYQPDDMVEMLGQLAMKAERGLAVTYAPRTTLLAMMHLVGKAFPRGNRSPDIVPIAEKNLHDRIAASLPEFKIGSTSRVDVGFYISQALELVRT